MTCSGKFPGAVSALRVLVGPPEEGSLLAAAVGRGSPLSAPQPFADSVLVL